MTGSSASEPAGSSTSELAAIIAGAPLATAPWAVAPSQGMAKAARKARARAILLSSPIGGSPPQPREAATSPCLLTSPTYRLLRAKVAWSTAAQGQDICHAWGGPFAPPSAPPSPSPEPLPAGGLRRPLVGAGRAPRPRA